MGGYTPGPWMLLHSIPEEGVECFWLRAQPGGGVCRGFSQDIASINGPQSGEQLANARLIAAAPELLEALFALLPHVEHADSCGDMDAYNNADVPTCGCGLDSARERANAAISRATGEGE